VGGLKIVVRAADLKNGPPPCLLKSYGRQAEGFGPAFRSVRAGRPQGGGPRYPLLAAWHHHLALGTALALSPKGAN